MHRPVRGALFVLAAAALWSAPLSAQDPARAPLRPGDRMVLKIWVDTIFADTVRVDGQGAVTLPRIGLVSFANVPADRVADSVRSAYRSLTRTPAVEATALRKVTVGGEVKAPGVYYLETGATIREAITAAAGITEIGSTGTILLMRASDAVRIGRWEERADAEVIVRSGDVIWVGREPWLKRNALSLVSGIGVLVSIIISLSR